MQPQTFTYTLIKSESVRPAAPPEPVTAPSRVRNSAGNRTNSCNQLSLQLPMVPKTCSVRYLHIFGPQQKECFKSNKIVLKTHLLFVYKVFHQAKAWILWEKKKKERRKKRRFRIFRRLFATWAGSNQPDSAMSRGHYICAAGVIGLLRRRHENSRLKTPGRNG